MSVDVTKTKPKRSAWLRRGRLENIAVAIIGAGFLMMFQYRLRAGKEDWNAPDTWAAFWTRRFFRLAQSVLVADGQLLQGDERDSVGWPSRRQLLP